ncbi:MAG: ComEC/Rec2 family competence protein [Candidatus Yanofskybacteria bacterium]|nr:ComEC/Rec2 family competence protein [Candidatus Yanofskybacteria bacterium]
MGIRLAPLLLGVFWLLVFANIEVWKEVQASQSLHAHFFAVGQGDAILIRTRQGHAILIDGGRGDTILKKLGGALPFWKRSLDLVVATHADADHIAGLAFVFERYAVARILWTGEGKETGTFERFLSAMERSGAQGVLARERQVMYWGDRGFLEVLAPLDHMAAYEKDANEGSIVLRLETPGGSALFPGDAPKSIEQELVNSGKQLASDVLLAGHHGSKTSSSPLFVETVRPSLAVVSAGFDNPYGHPHQETIETFGRYGIGILRTDLDGDITISFSY